MTEIEWIKCTDPRAMMRFLHNRVSDRKMRLFQVACCRRIWSLLPDETCREGVLLAERLADGQATDRDRRAIRKRLGGFSSFQENIVAKLARDAVLTANEKMTSRKPVYLGVAAVFARAAIGTGDHDTAVYKSAHSAEQEAEADLLRCVCGNPFRSISLLPDGLNWRNGLFLKLVRGAYEERQLPSGQLDNARLSVLAVALEEAGCTDSDILGHLRREDAVHVRGCFLIDLLIGR